VNRKKQTKSASSNSPPAKLGDTQLHSPEDYLVGSVDWRWRQFALGIMNQKPNYQAYNDAYQVGDVENDERAYQVACAASSQLLRNVKFRTYWRELIVESGFNDEVADSRLTKVMTDPNTTNGDLVRALKLYSDLGGRIINKTDVTSGGEKINPFSGLSTEELRRLAKEE